MNWEELTAPDFARAVKKVRGVCVLPVGCIEKHGEHLPLGTDYLFIRALAERAARLEPAVVFPPYYFGSIHEARHQPGTVAVRSRLFIELLENVCEEIARNGLAKIVLLNGHGGNRFLPHFVRATLERPRPYAAYLVDLADWTPGDDPRWKRARKARRDYHAGEGETSAMLAVRPELVKLRRAGAPGRSLDRLAHLPSMNLGISWFARFPGHYAGDARAASAAKGRLLLEICARKVAARLKAVKRDRVTAKLLAEFYARSRAPRASRRR